MLEDNIYNALEFRVNTNIKTLNVDIMLPDYEKTKNFEELDSTTKIISFRKNEVSESLFAYMRKIFPKIITAKQMKNL